MALQTVQFRAMGSPCSIRIFASSLQAAHNLVRPAIDEIARLEQTYSRYRHTSLLSKINAYAGVDSTVLDDEAAGLLDYAYQAWSQSDGLFDITSGVLRNVWDFRSGNLPTQTQIDDVMPLVGMDKLIWHTPELSLPAKGMELDFGGFVKEYAADAAAQVCRDKGITSGIVELGGDVRVVGEKPEAQPWKVGIRCPHTKGSKALAFVGLSEGAMASSGDYERYMQIEGKRYSHILNPKTGWPVDTPAHVSVIADSCLVAGTVCTVAMLKGEKECFSWLESMGLPYYVVLQNGTIVDQL